MISTKDLHIAEFKIRLTEDDSELVNLISRRLGIPPAVYLRSLIKQSIQHETNVTAVSQPERRRG